MPESIIDGTGSGKEAMVDDHNRLQVFAITEPEDKYLNEWGNVWSIYFTETPVGAGDYFFYLKNTGSKDLKISDIRIMCASADTFTYEFVSGTPSYTSSTALTPVARKLGSSKSPTATINSDTDTTNLTSEGVIFFERCATANTRYKLSTSSNILIPQGHAFAIKAATGTALVTCIISLIEAD